MLHCNKLGISCLYDMLTFSKQDADVVIPHPIPEWMHDFSFDVHCLCALVEIGNPPELISLCSCMLTNKTVQILYFVVVLTAMSSCENRIIADDCTAASRETVVGDLYHPWPGHLDGFLTADNSFLGVIAHQIGRKSITFSELIQPYLIRLILRIWTWQFLQLTLCVLDTTLVVATRLFLLVTLTTQLEELFTDWLKQLPVFTSNQVFCKFWLYFVGNRNSVVRHNSIDRITTSTNWEFCCWMQKHTIWNYVFAWVEISAAL